MPDQGMGVRRTLRTPSHWSGCSSRCLDTGATLYGACRPAMSARMIVGAGNRAGCFLGPEPEGVGSLDVLKVKVQIVAVSPQGTTTTVMSKNLLVR